jgi:catechol 2,3-dioxygenase-like lactoylglutathione lyase family enzyme
VTDTPAANPAPPFEQLDYVYMPSRDVAADVVFFTKVLGASLVFAIEGMGTRVAMVRLAEGPPSVLLADHVEGDAPVLVYRVRDLLAAIAGLEGRGWKPGRMLELPQGPCCSFHAPGGQRIAIYERTRPEVEAHFAGRRDF